MISPPSAGASEGEPDAGRRLPGLDGLRGLAVAWVLAFHLWPDAARGGWLGVGLFFTLSGYLITGLLQQELTSSGAVRLGRFMARRARRLLPAALVTVAGSLALAALVGDQPLRAAGVDALTAVLNVFNWHVALDEAGYAGIFELAPEPLAHFWSLAIEEQFYLVFPAAVALTRRPRRVVATIFAMGVGGVALWWGSADAYVATPVRALEIAAGGALALAEARSGWVRSFLGPAGGTDRRVRIAWAVLVAAAVAVTAVAVARLGPQEAIVFRGGPQLMALCWVVLVAAAARDGLPARLMAWPVLRWLGLRSYAVYLFHWPIIELTDWHPAVVIVVTAAAAEASFRLLEMPVRRGAGRLALPMLAAAVAVVAGAAGAAAASAPAPGIAERAEGTDELPAWFTERDPDSGSAAASQPAAIEAAPSTIPEPTTFAASPSSVLAAPPSTGPPSTGPPVSGSTPSDGSPPASEPTRDSDMGSTSPAGSSPREPSGQSMPGEQDPLGQDAAATAPASTVPVPPTEPSVPVVTVIGDSVALYFGAGLRVWADDTQTMAVVNRSRIACSPVGNLDSRWYMVRVSAGGDPVPMGWNADPPCRDDEIEARSKLVLVADHGAVLWDHQRPDGTWASILDADLASDVADSYRRLVREAAALGARVVFTTAPRALPLPGEQQDKRTYTDPQRAAAYNAILVDLASELGVAGVELIDTAEVLNGAGYDGPYGRSDGVHLGPEHAVTFAADVLVPALMAILGLE